METKNIIKDLTGQVLKSLNFIQKINNKVDSNQEETKKQLKNIEKDIRIHKYCMYGLLLILIITIIKPLF